MHQTCPICKSNKHIVVFDEQIAECGVCCHKFRVTIPDIKRTIETKYRSKCYWKQDKNHQGITRIEYSDEWSRWISSRISLLESFNLLEYEHAKTIDIFEYGCSEGMLLYELKQRGFNVTGNDVCEITEESKKILNIDILIEPIEELHIEQRFDLIMSFHVMEHLVDPDFVLRRMVKIAKKCGKIFLHIPIDDKEFGNSDHYHFFSRESLTYLMNKYADVICEDISTYTTSNGDVNGVMSILGQVREYDA